MRPNPIVSGFSNGHPRPLTAEGTEALFPAFRQLLELFVTECGGDINQARVMMTSLEPPYNLHTIY